MIIVTADSADEAADLHDLLGQHLAWRHRIYVGDAEYRPEALPVANLISPWHVMMRQILREASGLLTAGEAWDALAGHGAVVSRETVHRWIRADAAAGLVYARARATSRGSVVAYEWAGGPA